jgi:hypothetical protein
MEILLTAILASISLFVLAYTLVVMYRCICSRNYAEWRASWNDSDSIETRSERVLEGFPIQVNGHTHHIECIVTDKNLMASSCLQGQLKIWDATNGELVAEIDRVRYFEQMKLLHCDRQLLRTSDDSLSGSLNKSREKSTGSQMRLRNLIKFDFHNREEGEGRDIREDFQSSYEKYFPSAPINITTSRHSLHSDATDYEPMYNGFHEESPKLNSNSNSKVAVQRSNSLNSENNLEKCYATSPIWSLDFKDNLIVIGCADGRLEFWEGTTGNFKVSSFVIKQIFFF